MLSRYQEAGCEEAVESPLLLRQAGLCGQAVNILLWLKVAEDLSLDTVSVGATSGCCGVPHLWVWGWTEALALDMNGDPP